MPIGRLKKIFSDGLILFKTQFEIQNHINIGKTRVDRNLSLLVSGVLNHYGNLTFRMPTHAG